MSNRSRVITLLSMFALAAGCSTTTAGTGTSDPDSGASTTRTDAGTKKDGSTATTEDAGDDPGLDSGAKKDARADAADPDAGDPDAGDPDAGDPDAGDPDSGTVTDSGGSDAAVTCGPQNPVGFAPTWKAPAALHVNACTTTQVDTFMDCVFYTNLPQATCDAYAANAANAGCKSCLFTNETAATYGPMISSFNGDLMSLNVGGCIARTTNDVTANGCGAKVQAATQCETAACKPSCPIADNDYLFCMDDAAAGVCATYETAASCATALQAADASASACDLALGFDFIDNAKRYGRLFCMP